MGWTMGLTPLPLISESQSQVAGSTERSSWQNEQGPQNQAIKQSKIN